MFPHESVVSNIEYINENIHENNLLEEKFSSIKKVGKLEPYYCRCCLKPFVFYFVNNSDLQNNIYKQPQ